MDQFLQDGVNKRTDQYGGSFDNRTRFLREALTSIINAWDGESHRVGVRLSPNGSFLEISDSNPNALFAHVVRELDKFNLGYLHLVEPRVAPGGAANDLREAEQKLIVVTKDLKPLIRSPVVSAGGYTAETALEAVESGVCDMIAFGRYFISNPDLVERIRHNRPFNKYIRSTFYYSDDLVTGYIDYPSYEQLQ